MVCHTTSSPLLSHLFAISILVATLLSVPHVEAQEVHIPDALQDWVGWVLHNDVDIDCPRIDGPSSPEPVCVWPGTLSVDASEQGARFTLEVWTAREALVALPGDGSLWPQNVTANAQPAVLRAIDGQHPALLLPPGAHRITGELPWAAIPQYLPTPANIGLVSLQLNGAPSTRPRLDEAGRLWLDAERFDEAVESDRIRASIYRQIIDGSPQRIHTRIELNVSGQAREIDLGPVLLESSRPISLRSPLPVSFDGQQSLSVFARPGTHYVDIKAVLPARTERLTVPASSGDYYDPQEVWVWIPSDLLRSVTPSGLRAVDPSRTTLPREWHGHTTYLSEPGETLQLSETRRGTRNSPNTINLHRYVWLDLHGQGATFQDHFSGSINQGWRLDYQGKGSLGRVEDRQTGENLLITAHPDTDLAGVELRQSELDLIAEIRHPDQPRQVLAIGWAEDIQRLRTTVNLPPGWTLLHAPGTDSIYGPGTLHDWDLWTFFFLLIITLSIGKLVGWRWTPLAAIALVLSHGQVNAPMWIWLHLVVALALLRVLPPGFWRRLVLAYRTLTLLVLFLILAAFCHDQFRSALHPQVPAASESLRSGCNSLLETGTQYAYEESYSVDRFARISDMSAPAPRVSAKDESTATKSLRQIDPNAVVQTGPGVPTWSWQSWELHWDGPVHRDQELRLWLVPPTANRILNLLRIALMLALTVILLAFQRRQKLPGTDGDSDSAEPVGEPAAATTRAPSFWNVLLRSAPVFLAILLPFALLTEAHGAVPPQSQSERNEEQTLDSAPTAPQASPLLDILRSRLLESDRCEGPCVVVPQVNIRINGLNVFIEAEVHAQRDAGWYLPGPADTLQISSVRRNNLATSQFRRAPGGLTALFIPSGRHQITLEGTLASRSALTLNFHSEAPPRLVRIDTEDWTVDGLSDAGIIDSSLQLTRIADSQTTALPGPGDADELPAWYNVERSLGLGLPWQVTTVVTRENTDRSQLIRIPLLENERLLTDGFRVEGNVVVVDFPRGIEEIQFTGELPISASIALTAPDDQPWSETWKVECSRIWRCTFSDLAPITLTSPENTAFHTYKPWPGESLSIDIDRPLGVEGQSFTIDQVNYAVTPGTRLLEATLSFTVRASESHTLPVNLPADAELLSTTVDEESRTFRFEDAVLELPIRPGTQTFTIQWRQPWTTSFIQRIPTVDLGAPGANITITVRNSSNRWLLRTDGPTWGPALFFWPNLLVLILIALLLGLLRGLPLKSYEWVLLLIGFTQLPYIAVVPIITWFLFLTLRYRRPPQTQFKFNLTQLFLIFWTFVAAITLFGALTYNLLDTINMQIQGAGSTASQLRWILDRTDGEIGHITLYTLPVFVWRGLMLAWALWLVTRQLVWVPWGWKAFSHQGLWKSKPDSFDETTNAPEPRPDTPD